MEMSLRYLFFILIMQVFSACSLDMIAGPESATQQSEIQYNNTFFEIVPAYRTHLSATEDPRISERLSQQNQIALRELDASIRVLNRHNPAVRHTLVTEYNNTNFKYSDYIKNWRFSLELYGNSRFNKSLIYQAPSGNVLVDVAISKSGKLHSYNIILSTGSSQLNTVIKDIIIHNAPFAPLSANIQKDTDVLHITQMWQFRH
jgi:hypothetical protein